MTTQVLTHDEVTLLAPAGNFISVDSLTQLIRDVEAAVLRKVAASTQGSLSMQRIRGALGARSDLSVDECVAEIKNLQNQAGRLETVQRQNMLLQQGIDSIGHAAGCTSPSMSDGVALSYVRGKVEQAIAWEAVCDTIKALDPDYHGAAAENHRERVCDWIKNQSASRDEDQTNLRRIKGQLDSLYVSIRAAMDRLDHLSTATEQHDAAILWLDSIRPATQAEEKNMFALTQIDCMVLEAGLSDSKRPPFPFRARLLSAQMNANGCVKQARFRYGSHEIALEWPTIVLGMDAKP